MPQLATWAGLIGGVLSSTRRRRQQELYAARAVPWIVAAVSWSLGASIYRRIPEFGGKRLSGKSELEGENSGLVTTGMHAEVRHPIYLGHLLMLTGWASAAGTQAVWEHWITGVVGGVFMLRCEEQELVQRFGDDYREYQGAVPMVVPRSVKIFRLPSRESRDRWSLWR